MSFLGSYIECEAWIEYVEIQFNSSQLVPKTKKPKKNPFGAKNLICTIVDSKSLNILAIWIVLNILRVFYESSGVLPRRQEGMDWSGLDSHRCLGPCMYPRSAGVLTKVILIIFCAIQ